MRSDRSVERFALLLLLLVNVYIRFTGIGDFSLSNDELSAVTRLEVSTFTELIENGVIATDPHPAGTQVFLYYWTSVFGTSPFAIRFPFVVFGILGFFFLYATFRRWIGFQRAVLAISFISLLEFIIIHGQLARPYALGFFSTTVFVWAWDRFALAGDKKTWIKIAYVLSAVLSCYAHYFAGLFAGIVALTGLIVVYKKGQFRPFLWMNLAVMALFIPHVSVTIAQLSRTTLTAWIPPPESDFISTHIFILLNRSVFLLVLFLALSLWSLLRFIAVERDKAQYLLFGALFFLIPILIGYLYTQYAGPALMDRVLYFSAPYFLVLAFIALPKMSKPVFLTSMLLLTLVTAASTALETSFATRDYTEKFKETGIVYLDFIDEYKSENVLVTGNYNSPRYLEYYTKKTVPFVVDRLVTDSLLAIFMREVRYSGKPYLFHSWACMYQSVESVEYARIFYPNLIEQGHFYNSGYWFFGKENQGRDTVEFVHFSADSLAKPLPEMGGEYSNLLVRKMSELKGAQVVNARVKFNDQKISGMILVIQVKDQNGVNIMWKGKNVRDFVLEPEDNELMISYVIPSGPVDTDELYVYFWNSQSEQFSADEIWVTVLADSFYPDLE